mmetsp:Transcript_63917/g.169152  ORF Transcript_63917/g.169152 Transcript_63917/m.169152 type:complete len:226 (-) Transcript_63917:665-1342(-)
MRGRNCSRKGPLPPEGNSLGKSTWNRTKRSPCPPREGKPRPLTTQTSPGRMQLPSGVITSKLVSSRYLVVKRTPQRASNRETCRSMIRCASPNLEKQECFFSCTSTMISPVSMSGAWSAIPANTNRCPEEQPGGRSTVNRTCLATIPRPRQSEHVAPGGTVAPCPPQALHVRCTCVTKPRPTSTVCNVTPLPPHLAHWLIREAPRPRHRWHTTSCSYAISFLQPL